MAMWRFLAGEVYSVEANDIAKAREIMKAFFDGEWDEVAVTSDDINRVEYEGTDTRYIGEAEPGKMPYYYTYEDYGDTGPDEPYWVTPGTPFK